MTTEAGAQPPIDCETAMRSLWDYLDRALDVTLASRLDEHLIRCDKCRAHADFERTLIERIRAIRREHDDPARLRTAVVAALEAAGMRSPP
jgi:anti-sigma factor (TIGR02949 family)